MTMKNFRVRRGLTIAGETTASTSFAAPNTGTDQSYTLPTALPAVNGYVLASQTDGTMSWVANPDVNTTYDFNATSTTGGANLNLVGSDSTTDTVKLTNGGHITATYTSGTEVTLGSDATDANTASAIVSRDSSGNFSAGAITLANGAVLKDTTLEAVAYGQGAGTTSQGQGALAFGYNAGNGSQGQYAIATGYAAGSISQGQYSVAVGNQAGNDSQGQNAVAVGASAGNVSQANYAVAVGAGAGVLNQGEAAIAIGYFAGNGTTNAQPARTIILNATGAELDGVASQTDRLYIAPIRNATSLSGVLQYDATTKEVTYNTLPAATTYDFNASSTTGGANLNLAGSDATTDTVKLTNGGHITATYTSATEVTLGSDATDANTAGTIIARDASGNFAASGATLGAVTVGVDTDQTISTTSGNLVLQTAAGVNAGTLTLTAGANGSITLAPNGTGSVVNTFSNGGNLSSNRNIITGAIRNATTASIGDIWSLNTSTTAQPFRGVSVDNSADTTKNAGYVARNYSNTAANRSRIIFERARGTAASPTAVQSGDFIGEVDVTGYTSTGWLNDTVSAVPGFFGFTAAENWVSNTNLGTAFGLSLAPTATTVTGPANLVPVLALTPQASTYRGDTHAFQAGKSGTYPFLDMNGNRVLYNVPIKFPAFLATAVNGTLATTGASGTGSVATLTFGALASAPFTVGSQIVVAGVTPAGYNGTQTVTACTTTSVSFASTATGAQTVAGTIKVTGSVGWQIAISDSPTVGGRMAFWDTTNSRFSYISDNSAV